MEGSYNPLLVALSFVIAALASYTALDLAGRVRASADAVAARCWLVGGAFSMGTGIWAMHFIGMLAFVLPVPMGYDTTLTSVSLLAAVITSGVALTIVNTGTLNSQRLLLGGMAMGGGICTMHYVGMAAMKMHPPITYIPVLFACSVLIAVVASIAALWLACRINPLSESRRPRPHIVQRIAAACVMATAITGMHYTGMAAAQFAPGAHGVAAGFLSPGQLAGIVTTVAVSIMLATLVVSVYDDYQAKKTHSLTNSLKAANEELQFMLLHDPLTRLPNRLLLEERIAWMIARAKRRNLEFALLYIDLDRFKSVNDLLGHHIGDALIKETASRIRTSIRQMDMVARVGGDEFMVVLSEGEPRKSIEQVAQRICSVLSTMFEIEEHEIRISASVGISIYPQHGTEIHELIVHADAAMYYAKDIGKNNYQIFEDGMSTANEWRNKIAANLARAIDRDELIVVYQPQVDIATGLITGAEALVRWTDEELGVVNPQDFVPIAEDTGLILRLGEKVLYEACRQARQWQDQGLQSLKTVAVNVSAYQLNHKNFIETVEKILHETGLNPQRLGLELTESAVMQNPRRAGSIELLSNLVFKLNQAAA